MDVDVAENSINGQSTNEQNQDDIQHETVPAALSGNYCFFMTYQCTIALSGTSDNTCGEVSQF